MLLPVNNRNNTPRFPAPTYVVVVAGAREDGGEVEAQHREYLQEVREGRREGHLQRERRLPHDLVCGHWCGRGCRGGGRHNRSEGVVT